LIWNEATSRANVFLTVLSAAIVALALVVDATGFGPRGGSRSGRRWRPGTWRWW
jgi:hypothetical protein